jgi:hypothetical protein
MPRMTGAAALHVLLMRMSQAQDAYEVFGWTARTLFTRTDMDVRDTEFEEVMGMFDRTDWRRHPVRQRDRIALFRVAIGAYSRWIWAMDILYARLAVLDGQSGGDTDTE